MSLKWTGNHSESGILRKSDFKEKKEELFVFGYSCKLFRDDEKALHIDQGKHLIPWMGDETLKIDRYDARGALHDLSALEAPPGGFDWRVELTRAELDVEQLCDEERYRALHTDEDEEEMYKEEELKRLHAAGYGQVGFNYDAPAQPTQAAEPAEVDEPFVPTPAFRALLPIDIVFPESLKQNAIIEKTAKFIAAQGVQMEILIKAKQRDNPQFQFLNKESSLHSYYTAYIGLVKTGKWPEKKVEVVEEKPHENEDYLHPSLASTIIESAPAIPSIHYKPSADCDYTLLINKMRGDGDGDAAGDVPPPGTEPAAPPAHIYRAPVIYAQRTAGTHDTSQPAQPQYQQYAAYYQQQVTSPAPAHVTHPKPANKAPPTKTLESTGLSLMKNYNTDSDSEVSDFDDSSSTDSKDRAAIITPPEDVQLVIDKMAAYVARNGDAFADIVRAKNDPRFTFLEPDNLYHTFYKRLMNQKRGIDVNGVKKSKSSAPVSFSIKKLKEPDPILPKPALPYESSSDEDREKTDKQTEQPEDKEPPKNQPQLYPVNQIPQAVVYKMDGQLTKDLPTVKTIDPVKQTVKEIVKIQEKVPEHTDKQEERVLENEIKPDIEIKPAVEIKPAIETKPVVEIKPIVEVKETVPEKEEQKRKDSPKKVSPRRREDSYSRDSPYKRDKRKHRDRKKECSKSESRDRRSERRSVEREKRRGKDNDRYKKKKKYSKEELENEVISLVDNSDDLIDLTGDQSDTKGDCSPEAGRAKQQERRRRAAEFLRQVGVDPAAATALPATSLASAMVDTLESIRKKKAEDEEKRRRRDKRRHRDRREYDDESHRKNKRRKYRSSEDDDESDYESSKKKKRKKDKKQSSKNKKKRRRESENEEEDQLPVNIDLTNTLKELRTSSPTRDVLQDIDGFGKQGSSDEELRDRKKKREYSEGEWSSDSDADSRSSTSLKED